MADIVPEIIYRVFRLKHNNAARVNYSKPAARNRVFTSEIDGLFAALAAQTTLSLLLQSLRTGFLYSALLRGELLQVNCNHQVFTTQDSTGLIKRHFCKLTVTIRYTLPTTVQD